MDHPLAAGAEEEQNMGDPFDRECGEPRYGPLVAPTPRPRARRSAWRILALVFVLWIVLPLLLAEVILRLLLFSPLAISDAIRRPELYASSYWEDDYWKLRHHFASRKMTRTSHPLLGWYPKGDPETLRHRAADQVGSRRPVLLYGDSFAKCYLLDECVQDRLNNLGAFGQQYHLLNYAASGYGIDQIYLLMKGSIQHHENPIVIFSLATIDMSRNLSAFRGRPKPYFELENDEVELKGTPLELDVDLYLSENPVTIRSYLYRLLLFNPEIPDSWRDWAIGTEEKKIQEAALGRALLRAAIELLRKRGDDFYFLVYASESEMKASAPDYRRNLDLILDVLDTAKVPYISVPALILSEIDERGGDIGDYFLEGNSHPNERTLDLVSKSIQEAVLLASP